MEKLTSGERNLLRLVVKGAGPDGWATVSKAVLPVVEQLPTALVELEKTESGGRVRLTPVGQSVIDAMRWL